MDVSFSCVCRVIDHEFRHNIVKVAVDPRGDSRVDPQTNWPPFDKWCKINMRREKETADQRIVKSPLTHRSRRRRSWICAFFPPSGGSKSSGNKFKSPQFPAMARVGGGGDLLWLVHYVRVTWARAESPRPKLNQLNGKLMWTNVIDIVVLYCFLFQWHLSCLMHKW